MNKTNKVLKVASLVGAGALVIGATIGGAIMYNPVNIPSIQNTSFQQGVNSVQPITKIVNVTKEVPVEVVKEVVVNHTVTVVDNELVKATCDRLLFDDVKQCELEVKAENNAISKSLTFIDTNKFFDELENANIVRDQEKVEIIKVYNDFKDLNILTSNYDDNKYKIQYMVKVKDLKTDAKKKVLVTVVVEDGELSFKDVATV